MEGICLETKKIKLYDRNLHKPHRVNQGIRELKKISILWYKDYRQKIKYFLNNIGYVRLCTCSSFFLSTYRISHYFYCATINLNFFILLSKISFLFKFILVISFIMTDVFTIFVNCTSAVKFLVNCAFHFFRYSYKFFVSFINPMSSFFINISMYNFHYHYSISFHPKFQTKQLLFSKCLLIHYYYIHQSGPTQRQ